MFPLRQTAVVPFPQHLGPDGTYLCPPCGLVERLKNNECSKCHKGPVRTLYKGEVYCDRVVCKPSGLCVTPSCVYERRKDSSLCLVCKPLGECVIPGCHEKYAVNGYCAKHVCMTMEGTDICSRPLTSTCTACRDPVCAEHCVIWDGVNYCRKTSCQPPPSLYRCAFCKQAPHDAAEGPDLDPRRLPPLWRSGGSLMPTPPVPQLFC